MDEHIEQLNRLERKLNGHVDNALLAAESKIAELEKELDEANMAIDTLRNQVIQARAQVEHLATVEPGLL